MALKKSDRRPIILKAAFDLALKKGWEQTTIDEIAKNAKLPVETLYGYGCNTTKDILDLHNSFIDEKVISQFKDLKSKGEYKDASERERIFDLMMLRMEALNENRDGVKAILDANDRRPYDAVIRIPNIQRSMGRMLKTAEVTSPDLFREQAKVLGLVAIYATAINCWAQDETEGLSQTMRSLDNSIKKCDGWAKKLKLD